MSKERHCARVHKLLYTVPQGHDLTLRETMNQHRAIYTLRELSRVPPIPQIVSALQSIAWDVCSGRYITTPYNTGS